MYCNPDILKMLFPRIPFKSKLLTSKFGGEIYLMSNDPPQPLGAAGPHIWFQ